MCSPVTEDEKSLVSLAGKLKKNNVSVDFVLFGDLDDETESKLRAFNDKVKGGEGSNLVIIPPSGKLLSDQLISTPILMGEGAAASGGMGGGMGGGGGGGDFGEFDFDPSVDPELALALRMSMEEEKARQEKKAKEDAEAAGKSGLESVKEGDESTALLDKDGQPSGSGSKDKKDDADRMDTS